MKKYDLLIITILVILCFGGCTKYKEEKNNSSEETQEHFTEYEREESTRYTESTTEISKEEILQEILNRKSGDIINTEELEQFDEGVFFYKEHISDAVFERIDGVSFGEGCVMEREDLRYLRVLYYGFDENTHVGELICNKKLADDFLEIFKELFENKYPIEKMLLVDEYGGDDEMSMEDNNTSCFNYREVPGSTHLSQHAYGRAIDINPLYNPYVTEEGYMPYNAGDYLDREDNIPYKIDEDALCYKLFKEHGFIWGGNWNSVKDYQHFQKEAE
ncbi:MAG: M15 family metallopeptidase [Lachnospiraceae bacterium]|nr:M15 family metallopeptidase [Lachnospiraceae bacterium]